MTTKPKKAVAAEPVPTAGVQTLDSGWTLVTAGNWQISVGPDGLVQLPRHLVPREVADFLAACEKAAEVGAEVIANNEAAAAGQKATPLPSTLIINSGEPPASAVRLTGPAVQRQGARIGRRTSSG